MTELRVLPDCSVGDLQRRLFSDASDADPKLVSPPSGGLTARMVRKFQLGQMVPAALRHLRAAHGEAGTLIHEPEGHVPALPGSDHSPLLIRPSTAARLRRASPVRRQAVARPRRPGRRGRKDRDYAEVAQAYVLCLGNRSPAREACRLIYEAWGWPPPSTEAHYRGFHNMIYEARKRGFLTSPPRVGRPGGALTSRGREALQAESD